jgi:hypothetical protein
LREIGTPERGRLVMLDVTDSREEPHYDQD